MQSQKMKKTLGLTALLLVASAAVAFAQGGWGHRGPWMDKGSDCDYYSGQGRRGSGPDDGRDCGRRGGRKFQGAKADLTEEQVAEIDAARDKFFKETQTLRNQIRDKRIALGDAMQAETPEKAKVLELQKELSQLQGEFDQIAVEHRLEMRGLWPEGTAGRGYGRGLGRGAGGGYGRGAGGRPCQR